MFKTNANNFEKPFYTISIKYVVGEILMEREGAS